MRSKAAVIKPVDRHEVTVMATSQRFIVGDFRPRPRPGQPPHPPIPPGERELPDFATARKRVESGDLVYCVQVRKDGSIGHEVVMTQKNLQIYDDLVRSGEVKPWS